MNVEAFIIHLERAGKRQSQVDKIRLALPIASHVMAAVDWKALTESELLAQVGRDLALPKFPFRLKKSEIACFLSHRKAWSQIEQRGLDAALILEDDIEIDPKVFAAAYDMAVKVVSSTGFVRFPERLREKPGEQIASGKGLALFHSAQTGLGMRAQLISADCARQLLQYSQVFDRPVDGFLQLRWFHGIRPTTVFPAGISEVSHLLGGSTIRSPKTFMERIHAEVMRPVYRWKLARMARIDAKETNGGGPTGVQNKD